MEPKLVKVDNKQNKILIIVSLLVICLFIGSSYSLLSSNDTIEDAIVFKTGDLNLELTGDNNLTLDSEYPKSDDEGKENKAIKLTFKNTGTIDICNYEVKLISDSESTLDSKYLKYIISENNEGSYQDAKNLDDTNIVYRGNKLKVGKSKTIYVKVWIDENAKESGLSKTYSGSFEVELYQGGCGAGEIATEVVKETIIAYAESSKDTFTGGLVAVNTDGDLYNENDSSESIREYRYSGSNVNNYVTFNDETWRIVGVFKDENGEEHVKIVKNNLIQKDIIPETYMVNEKKYKIKFDVPGNNASWNYITATINDKNDWATAGLQYWLNAGSEKETKQPSDGYLSYLSEKDKEMIKEAKYYLGTVTFYDSSLNGGNNDTLYGIKDTPNEAYKNERKTKCEEGKGPSKNSNREELQNDEVCRVWDNNKATWDGMMALLYPSDYGYTVNSQYWNTRLGYGTFNEDVSKTSWLQTTSNHGSSEWLLSPTSRQDINVSSWINNGILSHNAVWDYIGVRPCLYLKSNVKIISGDGSQKNQYKLALD